jgi:hypothetical protein
MKIKIKVTLSLCSTAFKHMKGVDVGLLVFLTLTLCGQE